jgi:recombinational DNA repair ATPase RecF
MEKIKEFTIIKIKMKGFKAFAEETEFRFGRMSYIFGSNGQGKTTIADAIAYAFCAVPLWGEKSVERLMSKGAEEMYVEVEFVDGDGEIHQLIRRRKGSDTSITFDARPYRQTDLGILFAEKDIFLSILNPLYFIEKIAKDGREFLQKLLPSVSQEQILSALSEQTRGLLEKESLLDPEYYIKNRREKLKELSQNEVYISGQLDLLEEQLKSNEKTKNELTVSVNEYKAKIAAFMEKQFEGINKADIQHKYDAACKAVSVEVVQDLDKRRVEIEQRQYTSKFTEEIAKTKAELTAAYDEYNRLMEKAKHTRQGVPCPTCAHILTDAEFNSVRANMKNELSKVQERGKALKSQLNDLTGLDAQAKSQFDKFRAEDMEKVNEEFNFLKDHTMRDAEKLHDLLTYGNFSEEQLNDLEAMKAELFNLERELKVIKSDKEITEMIDSLKAQLKTVETETQSIKRLISAANEYIVKRAEIMLAPLKMNRAAIKLFDVVKTTGEIKPVFKFTFDNKDFSWLSNSEKIKAGIEVSSLLKRLTGLVYPTFIDNAESINTSFTRPVGQIMYACVKKCALMVREPAAASAQKEAA